MTLVLCDMIFFYATHYVRVGVYNICVNVAYFSRACTSCVKNCRGVSVAMFVSVRVDKKRRYDLTAHSMKRR